MPDGETTDRPLINPFGPGSPSMENVDLDPIRQIVNKPFCALFKLESKLLSTPYEIISLIFVSSSSCTRKNITYKRTKTMTNIGQNCHQK